MAILEFIEDDNPQLPPRPPPPPPPAAPAPPAAAAASTSKRPSTSSSSVAMLDLTGSPPPVSPPNKRAKIDTAQQLDEWFGDDQPQPVASTSAGAGQAGLAGTRRVVHTGAPPSAASVQPRPSSNNNGFARYATQSPTASTSAIKQPQQRASTSSFRNPPITAAQAMGQAPGLNRIPVISSASAARVPSARLPGQQSSPSSPRPAAAAGAGGATNKNYYKLQTHAVSASLSAIAAQAGLNPLPPGKRANSLNSLASGSSGSGSAGPSRSNTLPSTSNTGMIDLTDDAPSPPPGPSDDLIIPPQPTAEATPICIGQLTSLALILYPVVELLPPPPLDSSGNPLPPELAARAPPPPAHTLTPLPIHILRADPQGKNETLKLVTPGRRETFGVMEHRVANVVAGLFGEGWTGTGIGVPLGKGGKVWCEARVVRRGERNPMMLPLQLLLFTLPSSVPVVSSLLESHALFLEHPASYNPSQHGNARYQNPHNPMVGGLGSRSINNPGGYGIPRRPFGSQVESSAELQRKDVESTLMQLKSGTDLEESTPPPIVTTILYPHQKQALTFLLQREALVEVPPVDADPTENPTTVALWRRISDTYGRPTGWRSIVTEQEVAGREGVPQARGAILADDMGLGKTIVIISLIATTLPLAVSWAQQPPSKDSHDTRFDSIRSTAASTSKSKISLSDFSSNLYGLADSGPGTIGAPPLVAGGPPLGPNGKPLSKKALAKRKREMKKEDEEGKRFEKLVVRSRATLIVCPLSTVQNWESQLEEHTRIAGVGRGKKGGRGRKVVVSKDEDDEEGKRRSARPTKGKRRASDSEDDNYSDDDASFHASSPAVSAADNDDDPSSPRPFSIYIYHGNSRTPDPHLLANHDVVITTFSTLGTEFSKQQRAEEEREEEAAALAREAEGEEEEELMQVFGYDADGKVIETRPGEDVVKPGKPLKKRKKMRKKVEGVGTSPLQMVQWFRVVLDEAHIIKEHTTIQARAACELSAQRRIALSGTPLQNSLNDLFSLVRFLRLEPFTDRSVWTQHIGTLVKTGNTLGTERLQLIMRYLTLRRTKESTDKDGKPILALPPVSHRVIKLNLDPAETAFYSSHHSRYKHAFQKLEETDSVMKNFCSILQEILRLRQICVHMALVKDAEDLGGDLIETIEKHGISKPRAIQLLSLMKEAGASTCAECGVEMLAGGQVGDQQQEEDVKPDTKKKAPAKRARKPAASTSASASASALNSEDDFPSSLSSTGGELHSVITRCQHLFCRACFASHVYPGWPNKVVANDRASCSVCKGDMTPALDAVEVGANEFEKAVAEADGEDVKPGRGAGERGKAGATDKKGKATTRFFEHSTKTKALINDLLPFSRANPASPNYWGGMEDEQLDEEHGGTIGFQPVKGEVVKSVVFSQWTKLLDRLGDALDQEQIGYYRLDGGMNRDQRNRSMEAFKSDPTCEVLLVSLRAGGVGLNLTAGRRVYLMEPFWNPAVENQAVDRVYRLGQTMPVQTIRFVIDKSIEERMLQIQKTKLDLANNALQKTMSKAELQQQKKNEFKFLLGGNPEDVL